MAPANTESNTTRGESPSRDSSKTGLKRIRKALSGSVLQTMDTLSDVASLTPGTTMGEATDLDSPAKERKSRLQPRRSNLLLHVHIYEARHLPKMDLGGGADPFVCIHVGEQTRKTSIIKRDRYPVWNEQFVFNVPLRSFYMEDEVCLQVWDYNFGPHDRLIGEVKLNLLDLAPDHPEPKWYQVQASPKSKKLDPPQPLGQLRISTLWLEDPETMADPETLVHQLSYMNIFFNNTDIRTDLDPAPLSRVQSVSTGTIADKTASNAQASVTTATTIKRNISVTQGGSDVDTIDIETVSVAPTTMPEELAEQEAKTTNAKFTDGQVLKVTVLNAESIITLVKEHKRPKVMCHIVVKLAGRGFITRPVALDAIDDPTNPEWNQVISVPLSSQLNGRTPVKFKVLVGGVCIARNQVPVGSFHPSAVLKPPTIGSPPASGESVSETGSEGQSPRQRSVSSSMDQQTTPNALKLPNGRSRSKSTGQTTAKKPELRVNSKSSDNISQASNVSATASATASAPGESPSKLDNVCDQCPGTELVVERLALKAQEINRMHRRRMELHGFEISSKPILNYYAEVVVNEVYGQEDAGEFDDPANDPDRPEPIKTPQPLDSSCITDAPLGISIQQLKDIWISEEAPAYHKYLGDLKYSEVKVDKFAGDDATRTVQYLMPPNTMVKALNAFEDQKLAVDEPGGFIVEIICRTPDAPYGSTFRTKTQWIGKYKSRKTSTISVRAEVDFVKSTMMAKPIRNAAIKAATENAQQMIKSIQEYAWKNMGITEQPMEEIPVTPEDEGKAHEGILGMLQDTVEEVIKVLTGIEASTWIVIVQVFLLLQVIIALNTIAGELAAIRVKMDA
eukprot:Clim_evm8s224 gene=Clim_evmTU8s224